MWRGNRSMLHGYDFPMNESSARQWIVTTKMSNANAQFKWMKKEICNVIWLESMAVTSLMWRLMKGAKNSTILQSIGNNFGWHRRSCAARPMKMRKILFESQRKYWSHPFAIVDVQRTRCIVFNAFSTFTNSVNSWPIFSVGCFCSSSRKDTAIKPVQI